MITTDFLVIGGGIIGLCVARELKTRYPGQQVDLLEKEPTSGFHASGRNSGVLHAGFYYSADTLRARFTRDGNCLLQAYCAARGLPVNRCGKVVVARDEAQDRVLDELLARGRANGVEVQEVGADDLSRLSPRARTWRRALWSPTTATVDPEMVVAALAEDAQREGITLHYGVRYQGRHNDQLLTSSGPWTAGYVINAAGLYADQVARDFGYSRRYRILPFKGLYLKSSEPAGAIRTHIYPVPDLLNPFLGVHFTVQVDGRVKIGPTAIPALWREQYSGLTGFQPGEFFDIAWRMAVLMLHSDFDFRRLAVQELAKQSRAHLVALAAELAQGVQRRDYRHWGKAGIRAQLFDVEQQRLEMDFILEGDAHSLHILNAVSPAFTCAIPFARYVCDQIAQLCK
jgi:L-2-hydroxyglutarate oxidase LhgO